MRTKHMLTGSERLRRRLALLAEGPGGARARLRAPADTSRGPRRWDAPPPPVRSAARRSAPPPPPSPGPVPAQTAGLELPAWLSGMRPPPALTLAAGACVVAPPLVLVDAPPWARWPAVLLVVSLAPGTALLRILQRPGQRMEIGLAVGVSLAVTALAAQCMLLAGAWHPKLLVYGLAGICLAGMAAARFRVSGRRRIRPRAPDIASSSWSAAGVTRQREWDLVRRHELPAGLAPTPLSEPLGSYGREPDGSPDALITSMLVRAQGDPAAFALALSALLTLDGSNGAGGRNGGRANGPRSAVGGVRAARERALVQRPAPRRFSAEYKLWILREAEACTRRGEVTALLRREGLCTSHLTAWRRKRDEGELAALDRPRDREPVDRRDAENAELRRRAERAEAELAKARRQIEAQADVSGVAGELLEPRGVTRRTGR
jgi:transposase